MSELGQLQALFWRAARTQVPQSELSPHFRGTTQLDAAARLGIYRTAYWVRQINTLRELFPRVVEHLGDGPFARSASRYLGAEPSTHGAIELIGRGFAAWLAREHGGRLGALAGLEFASWEVFVAPDIKRLEVAATRAPGFAEASLSLGPHLRTVVLPRELLRELGHGAGGSAEATVAVWREGFEVLRREVGAAETRAIDLASTSGGAKVTRLCEVLGEGEGGAAFVFEVLTAWFERGWVVSP
jgi:hypothetical protein